MSDIGLLCDIISPDFSFTDDRGTIYQLIHDGYKQVNAVFTKKGKQRGQFHYHKNNEELFFIAYGSVRVQLKLQEQTEVYIFSAGDMFQIHKNVQHDFSFLEDTLLIGFYDRGVEMSDGSKDIYTDE